MNLALILILAGLLRLGCAAISLGYDHPHEAYRLLEPLIAHEGFSSIQTWEWQQGILSPLPIAWHVPLLHLISALGVHESLGQLIALRMAYGLFSLVQVYAAWALVRRHARPDTRYAWISALTLAVWPEFIYRSVRLSDFALEGPLLALALLAAFCARGKFERFGPFIAGAVLAISFFVRYQTGLYYLAIAGAMLFAARNRRRFRRVAELTLSYGLGVLILALYEMHLTQRGFLAPFVAYMRFNWVENGAVKGWGAAPWHRYFSELAKYYGFLLLVPLVLGAIWDIFGGAYRASRGRALLWVFLLPFVVHTLIAHKEARFIFGFAWTLVPLAAVGLSEARLSRQGWQVLAVCALAALGFNLERISRRLFTGNDDIRQWARIGRELETAPVEPLYVMANPADVPGAFFLRQRGRLCYQYFFSGELRQEGQCTAATPTEHRRILLKTGSLWTLQSP